MILAVLAGLLIAGLASCSLLAVSFLLSVLVLPFLATAAETLSGWRADRDRQKQGTEASSWAARLLTDWRFVIGFLLAVSVIGTLLGVAVLMADLAYTGP